MRRDFLIVGLLALTALAAASGPGLRAAPASGPLARTGDFLSELPPDIQAARDAVSRRLLADYGAMFVAQGVALPPTMLFPNAAACARWQAEVASRRERVGGSTVELQTPAMDALLAAEREAEARGLRITPTGSDASRRDYQQTVQLWRSRVDPGLRYWVARKRLEAASAAAIRALPVAGQIGAILQLEQRGLYFSRDRRKSILYSVAAPGASQHLAMLALDVRDGDDPVVRAILARHGWFQTVVSDAPHFTYLGVAAKDLPRLGLHPASQAGRIYWLPTLPPVPLLTVSRRP